MIERKDVLSVGEFSKITPGEGGGRGAGESLEDGRRPTLIININGVLFQRH